MARSARHRSRRTSPTTLIIAIDWPRPDFRMATLELLIGLLATACPPRDHDAWLGLLVRCCGWRHLMWPFHADHACFRAGWRWPAVPYRTLTISTLKLIPIEQILYLTCRASIQLKKKYRPVGQAWAPDLLFLLAPAAAIALYQSQRSPPERRLGATRLDDVVAAQ